ncbi:serine/threonine-protein kinase-like protein At1g28390 [Neltuma alba]|uniref:serine/threonine-protein kinase-like protein At1g28390 n=1 Tax=Neltuma alba TaxID=207710 RepID=UPI0010A2C083|nr:serine/threonine-protein kinase-like protein At1g28390 [Prosopis alba]
MWETLNYEKAKFKRLGRPDSDSTPIFLPKAVNHLFTTFEPLNSPIRRRSSHVSLTPPPPLPFIVRRCPPTSVIMGFLSCNAESAAATCDSHYWDLKKKASKSNRTRRRTHNVHKLVDIRKFQFSELLAATGGFSADCFLGKGSHGSVYKAILDDGKLIAAVKRTKFSKPHVTNLRNHSANCTGCANCTSPAENEIEILSRVRNPRRFVNLIGFCTDSNGSQLIVVEYMLNGSLYDALHCTTRPPGWSRRVRFALQVAKAVLALHSSNPPVIHRDIKSSNVLIDEKGKARLGDFGLALRGHVEDVRVKCTPPAGTMGYLDPCYLAPGDVSAKSDVFSFGILLLEIISGRNAIDLNYSPPSVVDWAVPLIKRGEFLGICDRRIGRPSDKAIIRQLGTLAAKCVRSTAEKRPSMSEAVEWLEQVRKRVEATPIWRGLRRREENNAELGERREEAGRIVRGGSRRNGKVSSVGGAEQENETSEASNGVSRSRSMPTGNVGGIVRRLNRSRSMSVEGLAKFNSRADLHETQDLQNHINNQAAC